MMTSDGTYYEVIGSGPPMVLAIGFGQDSTAWTFVADLLKADHQLLLVDNRGCGRSPHPQDSFSVADLAGDICAVLDLLDWSAVTVVGQSMGGAIAQTLALARPNLVSELVLVNSFSVVDRAGLAAFEGIQSLLEHGTELADVVRCLAPWVYSSEFLSAPGRVDEIVAAALANPYPQPTHSYVNQLEALKSFDSTPLLPTVSAPTLVIGGRQDRLIPPDQTEALAAALPNSTLTMLPTGHGSHIERPDLVAQTILDFLGSAR